MNKVTISFVSQSSQYNSQIIFAGDEISRLQPHGGGAERHDPERGHQQELEQRSTRRFVIIEMAPSRAFSWLKAATTGFY